MKNSTKDVLFYSTLIIGYMAFSMLLGNLCINITRSVMSSRYQVSPQIIIDPGHGGEDSGAIADNGILEKDINLDIAKKLRDLLVSSGFKIIMTRTEDIAIYEKGSNTLRQKKASDMKKRLEIINSNPNNILVSIHQNKFDEKKYSGAQVWYSKNNPVSENLANAIKQSFVGLIQPDNKRDIKPADKNIFILYNAKVPAVIVECGFISNEPELQKLANDEYKSKVAFSIYCGIVNCKIK